MTCARPGKGYFLGLVVVVLSTLFAWGQSSTAGLPTLPPELESVRSALAKYQDPIVAVRDGYFSTLGCVEFPRPAKAGHVPYPLGAMGIHFVNPDLVKPVPDPAHPVVLLYEPDGEKLRLVGAEWFVPLATGVKQHPQLFGHPFHGPMEGHYPLMPLELHHYDLHVWLFKANPEGLFSPTNPAVKCKGYAYSLALDSPLMLPEPKP